MPEMNSRIYPEAARLKLLNSNAGGQMNPLLVDACARRLEGKHP